jgi:hypothetical protein
MRWATTPIESVYRINRSTEIFVLQCRKRPRRAAMREINARGKSMRMPVMNIREMRVRMRDRRMGMLMGVRLVAIPREIVLVLVMRVVPMTMRVVQRGVRVRMLVTFADVQPDTQGHQGRGHPE